MPYSLDKVLASLQKLDSEMVPGAGSKQKQGPFFGKLTRFIQRLEAKKSDRRLGFLFTDTEYTMKYEWMHELCMRILCSTGQQSNGGVKIIDFSEVPSDILPLIIGLVARIAFFVQQWDAESRATSYRVYL